MKKPRIYFVDHVSDDATNRRRKAHNLPPLENWLVLIDHEARLIFRKQLFRRGYKLHLNCAEGEVVGFAQTKKDFKLAVDLALTQDKVPSLTDLRDMTEAVKRNAATAKRHIARQKREAKIKEAGPNIYHKAKVYCAARRAYDALDGPGGGKLDALTLAFGQLEEAIKQATE